MDGVEQVWTKATALHRFWQLIDESSQFMVDVPPPPVGADGESDVCVVCRYVCALPLCDSRPADTALPSNVLVHILVAKVSFAGEI